MKKRIITGAAAALTAAVSLGACGMYGPPQQQNVYGPPEYYESETETEMTTTELTSSDTYDPVDSEIECVYGPPEWFGIEETTSEDTTAPASAGRPPLGTERSRMRLMSIFSAPWGYLVRQVTTSISS